MKPAGKNAHHAMRSVTGTAKYVHCVVAKDGSLCALTDHKNEGRGVPVRAPLLHRSYIRSDGQTQMNNGRG
jgi:hypothetical protein